MIFSKLKVITLMSITGRIAMEEKWVSLAPKSIYKADNLAERAREYFLVCDLCDRWPEVDTCYQPGIVVLKLDLRFMQSGNC
jgi:hypothetical protein